MSFIKKYYWIFISIIIFAIDFITKKLVLQHLQFEQPTPILKIFVLYFGFFFTFNTGSAFGFLDDAGGWQEWLFIGIAIITSIWIVIWQFSVAKKDYWLKIALAFIFGGTLGNLYDRIVYHHVIDFIDFNFKQWHYPTFNLADSAICVGAAMLIFDYFRKEKRRD